LDLVRLNTQELDSRSVCSAGAAQGQEMASRQSRTSPSIARGSGLSMCAERALSWMPAFENSEGLANGPDDYSGGIRLFSRYSFSISKL
jgi:hypothetical protein